MKNLPSITISAPRLTAVFKISGRLPATKTSQWYAFWALKKAGRALPNGVSRLKLATGIALSATTGTSALCFGQR